MLTQETKNHFIKFLNQKEESYDNSFNFDILNFLCLENSVDKNVYDDFFTSFERLIEIEKWIDLVKSKIVMHEHEDEIDNIISEYIDLQTNNKKSLCLN
jgi:hypothetical protein